MSDRRPVTLIEITASGEMIIEAVLDDGFADSDGIALDPGWLSRAARDWLQRGGALRDRQRNLQATATQVWRSGDETMLRARVADETMKGLLTGNVPLHVSIGITSPRVERGEYEPVGKITDGTLEVGLEGSRKERVDDDGGDREAGPGPAGK